MPALQAALRAVLYAPEGRERSAALQLLAGFCHGNEVGQVRVRKERALGVEESVCGDVQPWKDYSTVLQVLASAVGTALGRR